MAGEYLIDSGLDARVSKPKLSGGAAPEDVGLADVAAGHFGAGVAELGLDGAQYDYACTVIRNVDNEYVAMLNRRRDEGPEMADTAKVTDPEGVKRVVRGLGNRYKAAKGRKT